VQHHGEVRTGHQRDYRVGEHHVGDLGRPHPARLLPRFAGGAAPAGERTGRSLALPDGYAAGGRPRHDPCHADLGEDLDGELAAVALRDRLDHDQLGGRPLLTPYVGEPDREPPLAGLLDRAGAGGAGAVGEHHRLPHPQPSHGDGVMRLVAGHLDERAGIHVGERVGQVDREAHQ
jgi:hypothetical protein